MCRNHQRIPWEECPATLGMRHGRRFVGGRHGDGRMLMIRAEHGIRLLRSSDNNCGRRSIDVSLRLNTRHIFIVLPARKMQVCFKLPKDTRASQHVLLEMARIHLLRVCVYHSNDCNRNCSNIHNRTDSSNHRRNSNTCRCIET